MPSLSASASRQWPRDPQGIYFGGNDMLMTPRQMLAFGELYLGRGRVEGRQVVPEKFVEESFVPRGRSRISGREYGYGWWIREMAGRQTYYAWGFGGQFIILVPSLDAGRRLDLSRDRQRRSAHPSPDRGRHHRAAHPRAAGRRRSSRSSPARGQGERRLVPRTSSTRRENASSRHILITRWEIDFRAPRSQRAADAFSGQGYDASLAMVQVTSLRSP